MKDNAALVAALSGEVEIGSGRYNSTLPTRARNILCENTQASNRLRYQLNRIRRLHEHARETGIALDPAACDRELDDVIEWATRTRP